MRADIELHYTTCAINMRFEAPVLPRALEMLASAAGPIRAKPGCVSCRMGNDLAETYAIIYTEEWSSEEAFQRHVQSEEFMRVLLTMDLCCVEPEVVIGKLVAHRGMDYLRQLRLGKHSSQPKIRSDSDSCP